MDFRNSRNAVWFLENFCWDRFPLWKWFWMWKSTSRCWETFLKFENCNTTLKRRFWKNIFSKHALKSNWISRLTQNSSKNHAPFSKISRHNSSSSHTKNLNTQINSFFALTIKVSGYSVQIVFARKKKIKQKTNFHRKISLSFCILTIFLFHLLPKL